MRLALHLQPDSSQELGAFRATLHHLVDGVRQQVTRSVVLAHTPGLLAFAKELSKGALGKPAASALQSADAAMLAMFDSGSGLADLLRAFAMAKESRLWVHFDSALPLPTRSLLEALPWGALGNASAGCAVLLSPRAPDDATLGAPSFAGDPRDPDPLKVLVVLSCIEQGPGQSSLMDAATLVRTLRAIEGQVANPCTFEVVASAHTIRLLAQLREEYREMCLTEVGDRRKLLQLLKDGGHHVWHFVGHSNAVGMEDREGLLEVRGASALLLGLRIFAGSVRAHARENPDDVLTAAQLAELVGSLPPRTRPVLTVFDNCAVGGEFLAPVLSHVPHAIGTIGLISPRLGQHWAPKFYGELGKHVPVGDALSKAREVLTSSANGHGWQLSHWATSDRDRPFGTPRGAAMRAYRNHAQRRLEELEGSFRGKGRLDSIAIPLAVVFEQRESDRSRNGAETARRSEREPRPAAELTLLDLLRDGTRCLVLGEAGAGKTTSARHAADVLLREINGEEASALVPVYLRLPGSKTLQQEHPQLRAVLAAVVEDLKTSKVVQEQLEKQVARLVLLLDGYDELQGRELEAAENLVKNLVDPGQPQVHAFAIACRTSARPVLAGVDEYRLELLDEDRQRQVLAGWFRSAGASDDVAAQRAQRVVQTIREQSGSLRDLMRLPLYLGLLGRIALAQQDDQGLAELRRLVQRRHTFFEEAIRVLLTDDHKQPEKKLESVVSRPMWMLGRLAFDRLCDNELRWPYALLKERVNALTREVRLEEGDSTAWDEWLELFQGADVLRPVRRSESKGEWEFAHRSLLEAMAARYLAAVDVEVPTEREAVHEQRKVVAFEKVAAQLRSGTKAAEDPARFWRETFALTAGFLGDAAPAWIEGLCRHMVLQPIALAAMALADSHYVSAKLLHRVLWMNRGLDWKARVPVYENLLPPFGRGGDDQIRAELLKYVGRERRSRSKWLINGNELCWIDHVFEKVGEEPGRDAADKLEIAAQRERLMRLIGMRELPADLVHFLTDLPNVSGEDPVRRGVPTYWRHVPAGYAKMGSPSDERGRRANEPLTSIHIGEAFWMAEVHVTKALWSCFSGEATSCSVAEVRRGAPVCEVAWYASAAFARWLCVHLRGALRQRYGGDFEISLPTEWQWEYAARARPARTTRELDAWACPPFGWAMVDGQIVGVTHANLDAVFGARRSEPGESGDPAYYPNPLGLRDMTRFLFTWCDNPYGAYRPVTGPVELPVAFDPYSGFDAPRVMRGGSCSFGGAVARAACRISDYPEASYNFVGLRLVCFRIPPSSSATNLALDAVGSQAPAKSSPLQSEHAPNAAVVLSGDNVPLSDQWIVLLLFGKNHAGERIYSFVKLSISNMRRLKTAIAAGKGFNPSEFGEVLAAGKGEPPQSIRDEISNSFRIVDYFSED